MDRIKASNAVVAVADFYASSLSEAEREIANLKTRLGQSADMVEKLAREGTPSSLPVRTADVIVAARAFAAELRKSKRPVVTEATRSLLQAVDAYEKGGA